MMRLTSFSLSRLRGVLVFSVPYAEGRKPLNAPLLDFFRRKVFFKTGGAAPRGVYSLFLRKPAFALDSVEVV